MTMKFILVMLSVTLLFACRDQTSKQPGQAKLPEEKKDDLFTRFNLDKIKLPAGFSISVFAVVPDARSMCWGSQGTLFVGNRDDDKVYAVVDKNQDGMADTVHVIDKNLKMPNGVAFRNGSLYVSALDRVLRYDDIENHLADPPKPVVVYDKYPDKTHHGWKFIAFGPDGKLYIPVGAACNICDSTNKIYASITRMNPDGSGMEIFARGIRNTVGFDWHPVTKELWFTDNGRDELGDDVPGDELDNAPRAGMHFGYPYCHQGNILDPEFGKGKKCSDYTPPAQILGPHVAALGMRFYTGSQFPAEYKNRIFIAEHGSWNRSIPIGYRIMMVTLDGNKAVKYEPFATGWLQNDKDVLGRPVDVILAKDGALLVSDDKNGAIYRVAYTGTK